MQVISACFVDYIVILSGLVLLAVSKTLPCLRSFLRKGVLLLMCTFAAQLGALKNRDLH